jgi:glycosyltransferase involved in cell wall biosynthesis
MKKEVCDRFHIDPRFVGVWTSGVSTTLFDPEKYAMSGRALKRTLGLSDKFIVIYHGSLGPKRGVLEAADSIIELGGKYRNVLLFLLGSGPALPNLMRVVQERKIEDRVLVHEPVDYEDVPKYISMSDIGIVPLPDIPDWRNQSPLKLLEYLAMRKVVIVTDINAHREILGDSKCGIYVSSADAKQIAKAIEYAYDNKENLKDLGSGGRKIIVEKYDWKKVAKDFDSYLMSTRPPISNRSV